MVLTYLSGWSKRSADTYGVIIFSQHKQNQLILLCLESKESKNALAPYVIYYVLKYVNANSLK